MIVRTVRKDRKPTISLMHLDTLFIDIAHRDRSRHRAHLSWRMPYDPEGMEGASFVLVKLVRGPLPVSVEEITT